ncbi:MULTISPECIES: hypothetical protein [Roseateles]|uniref:Uncharacterized protein n=1 Tax=Pelomonas aquatica TaxID=431058 RepID=A0ABU1Z2D6_9BURK|nr:MULTISPECIES: hypothetical protein [Roseateles]KQY81063.1 hypothetical protein ASD35_04275 [Pelomonas sp. Root1444]MDR7294777.1 hypothetical protein [Pelomonas aquatica]
MDRRELLTCSARAALLAAAVALQGCAVTRIDEAGRTHVAGLVWMTLPASKGADKAADLVRTRSVGVTLTSGPLGQAVTLGYSDQTLGSVRNHSLVRVPRSPQTLDGVD